MKLQHTLTFYDDNKKINAERTKDNNFQSTLFHDPKSQKLQNKKLGHFNTFLPRLMKITNCSTNF